jgi:signal peptidase I
MQPEQFDHEVGGGAQVPERSLLRQAWDFVSEILHVVIISLAIIIPVRYFLIQPFYVKGASMEPNFYDHEYLIIDELSYRFHQPRHGEIVVFRYPNDPRQYFIKRVIGVPGDRIKVSGGKVTVFNDANPQGTEIDETQYLGVVFTAGDVDTSLGQGEYFLMGDNRAASLDSRIFGPVDRSYIVGRVWLRGWPPDKFKVFNAPKE